MFAHNKCEDSPLGYDITHFGRKESKKFLQYSHSCTPNYMI